MIVDIELFSVDTCLHMNAKNVPATCSALSQQIRAYATAAPVDAVKRIHYRPKSREYGDRKTHLHAQYARLLQSNNVVLLVRYDNVKVNVLDKLRRDVVSLASKPSLKTILSPSTGAPPTAAVTFIRPGVFSAALRTRFDEATVQRAIKTLRGSYALISARELNPPQLAQLIRLIDRAAPSRKVEEPPARKGPINPDDIEDAPPKVKAPPSIHLVAGVVENKFFLIEDIVAISKLPTLQTLQAQIVGLLSTPAAKLSQILGIAAGGDLLRTLRGFEKGLEEDSKASGDEKSA